MLAFARWLPEAVPAGRRRRRKRPRGLTLVELLIAAAMLGTLAAIGMGAYRDALDKARIARAIADIQTLEREIALYQADHGHLPDTLADLGRENLRDPWGNPYEYLKFSTLLEPISAVESILDAPLTDVTMRLDQFLVPLNSTYDLYSKGKDGKTKALLTAEESWDDIVRANDGGYIGLASEY